MPNSLSLTGKLEGFEEFDRLLKELPERVENNVLQSAVTAGARVAAKSIVAAAPEDVDRPPPETAVQYWLRKLRYGRLKDDIKVKTSTRDKDTGQRGAYITTGKGFWGYFLEKGWRYRAAQPWFEPAFAEAKDAVLTKIGEILGKGIEREAKK